MAENYRVPLKAMPNIGRKAAQLGRCPDGHDLTLPGSMSCSSNEFRCTACWHAVRGPALCRSGDHVMPAGARRCPACAQAAKEKVKDLSWLFVGLPPMSVLEGAACTPEQADLFDIPEGVQGRPPSSGVPARARQALAVCEGCPVMYQCRSDALKWRREGVYGGAYFTRRWHQAYRSALRNRTEPPALRTLLLVQARENIRRNKSDAFDTYGTLDTPGTDAVA